MLTNMLSEFLLFCRKNFFLFTFFAIIIFIFFVIYLEFFLIKKNFVLEIKRGENAYSLSEKLYQTNVISCKFCFSAINFFLSKTNMFTLKEGEYEFTSRRLSNFFSQITHNKTKKYPLKITEGLTLVQIKNLIENAQFLSGEISTDTLKKWHEGYFMPDTYFLEKNFDRNNFILMAIKDMDNFVEKVWQTRKQDFPLKDKKELLILASIVEAETPIAKERNEVAGVYLKRLRDNIPLCADPVLVYYETKKEMCGQYKLYFKHLKTDHDYNVYKNKGLPPTPICNPSRESILAVLNANKTENLFFVATGNGGHFFSKTFDEHRENIKIYKDNLEKKKLTFGE